MLPQNPVIPDRDRMKRVVAVLFISLIWRQFLIIGDHVALDLAKTPSPVATASAHLNDGSEARDRANGSLIGNGEGVTDEH